MTSYVALLRGINVSGRNKIGMADLQALFRSLPAENVTTYVQSGNVIFRSTDRAQDLQKNIEAKITDNFGLSVTVLLRTMEELCRLVEVNPFLRGNRDVTRFYVTLLAEAPDASKVESINASAGAPDEFRVVGREVFLYCPGGYGNTKLNNAFFEKKLAVRATTRNWKTVTTLAHLASG